LTFFYRYIGAMEEAFNPLLAACFLILMCSLCISSYTAVLVSVTGTHNMSYCFSLLRNYKQKLFQGYLETFM